MLAVSLHPVMSTGHLAIYTRRSFLDQDGSPTISWWGDFSRLRANEAAMVHVFVHVTVHSSFMRNLHMFVSMFH